MGQDYLDIQYREKYSLNNVCRLPVDMNLLREAAKKFLI